MRILFVAMQNSVHTARWLDLIADEGWDIHLFPLNPLSAHEMLRNVTVHQPLFTVRPRRMLKGLLRDPEDLPRNSLQVESTFHPGDMRMRTILALLSIYRITRSSLSKVLTVRTGESDMRVPVFHGPRALAGLIRRLKPDLVHSMEFQHAGYLTLRSKEIFGESFPPWLATNWGSDIYYYQHLEGHRAQIKRLLGAIDYYSCECHRDVALAKELGLTGKALPVLPNSGGFDLDHLCSLRNGRPPSQRRLVMVKGYQSFAGRALTALEALERCADALKSFEIVLYSATPDVGRRARQLAGQGVLNIRVTDDVPNDEILRLQGLARLYLGVSISDAISTSMLEAMSMGAFPIQTNTSCCEEWIEDGRTGFVIPPDDVDLITDRIRRALTDDALVDRAADINWQTVKQRLDKNILKNKVLASYDQVFNDITNRQIN